MTDVPNTLRRQFPNVPIINTVQDLTQKDFDLQKHKHLSRQALGGAVGVVMTKNNAIVLVKRSGMHVGWALPGGTVEKGEDFKTAYEREILEEIGITFDETFLVLIEEKVFRSPKSEEFGFLLALFNSYADITTLPSPTQDAQKEGLHAQLFPVNELPKNMILNDRQKIDWVLGQ